MLKPWLYYLLEADGRSLQVVNGVVTSTSSPRPLANTPDGWQDISIAWERSLTKWGVNRNFSIPLGFVRGGATILRKIFYSQNIEREIRLLIQKLELDIDDDNFRWIYRYFYKGELDLSTFKDDGTMVKVNIMEGGLVKKLKAGEGTVFEVPLNDDSETILVKMDGMFLSEKHNFIVQPGTIAADHLIGLIFTNKEGRAHGVGTFSIFRQAEPADLPNSLNYFLTTGQDITGMRLVGSVSFTVTGASGLYKLYLKTGDSARVLEVLSEPVVSGNSYSFDFDYEFDAFESENFFLVGDSPGVAFIEYEETDIYLEFESRYKTTYIKAHKPKRAMEVLTQKITGDEDDAESTLLEDHAHLALSCGNAVRGDADAVIKSSLNTFHDCYNVILNTGLGVQGGAIVIEEKADFFDESDPIDLGEVKDLEVSLATDLLANTLKIGYGETNTDDVNGKLAFNNSALYTSPISRVVKEFSLICPAVTDPFAIEIMRIENAGKDTTDSSTDNKLVILNVDLESPEVVDGVGTVYPLKRETYSSSEGLPNITTAFNIEELTPRRLVDKHANWLRSMFWGFDTGKLTFQTTERNADLSTTLAGETVDEDSDVLINSLADPLFQPVYFDFATQVPAAIVDILETNPNRCFQFTWDGVEYKGFNIKIAQAPNTQGEQKFRLLSAPSNDLSNLII